MNLKIKVLQAPGRGVGVSPYIELPKIAASKSYLLVCTAWLGPPYRLI